MSESDLGTGAAAVMAELARRFRAGDIDGANELYHPELRIEQPSSLPHGGVHRGREGAAEMAKIAGEYWGREIGDPTMFESGDTVVQVTTQTWTAKATGRSATVDVVELITVTDGLVAEIRVFQQDTYRLLETLEPDTGTGDDSAQTRQ